MDLVLHAEKERGGGICENAAGSSDTHICEYTTSLLLTLSFERMVRRNSKSGRLYNILTPSHSVPGRGMNVLGKRNLMSSARRHENVNGSVFGDFRHAHGCTDRIEPATTRRPRKPKPMCWVVPLHH
jgi:hypothetical protein